MQDPLSMSWIILSVGWIALFIRSSEKTFRESWEILREPSKYASGHETEEYLRIMEYLRMRLSRMGFPPQEVVNQCTVAIGVLFFVQVSLAIGAWFFPMEEAYLGWLQLWLLIIYFFVYVYLARNAYLAHRELKGIDVDVNKELEAIKHIETF